MYILKKKMNDLRPFYGESDFIIIVKQYKYC